MKEKILLFIPMYNCEKQIIRVLNQIDINVKSWITEVLVVNNISTDNGEEAVCNFIDENQELKISILRNNENYGLGGSHKVAFSYAVTNGFDYMIVLHGDDQGNINDIIPFLENGEHKEVDCLLGARFHKKSKLKGYSYLRTIGNRVYNALFSIVTNARIYDLGSGLNCYNTRILNNNFYHRFPDNLTFNYCMILASIYYKHRITFIPISWREDDQVSNVKLFSQAITVLNLLRKYAMNKRKFLSEEHRVKPIDHYFGKIVNSTHK